MLIIISILTKIIANDFGHAGAALQSFSAKMIDFIAVIWPVDQHNIGRVYDKWGCRLRRLEWQNSELNAIDLMLFTLLWPPIDFLSRTYGVMALGVRVHLRAETVELTHTAARVWFVTWIPKKAR